MPNGIVNNEEEKKPYMEEYAKRATEVQREPGIITDIARKVIHPAYHGSLGIPKIVHDQARNTSDRYVQDRIQQEHNLLYQPIQPTPIGTPAPATTTQAPTPVVSAPTQTGESYTDIMSKQWEDYVAGGGGVMRWPSGETSFLSPTKMREASEDLDRLELEKQLGVTPRTGMAEYEAGATRMRERSAMEGIVSGLPRKTRAGVIAESLKSRGDIERTRIGAISEQEKAKSVSQAKIYESAIKSQADWAKLGISADDVRSKQQYRKAQVDDLMTRTGLLEPMKLQLAQAKTGMESRKIQRDFAMQALDKVFAPRLKEYQDSVMSGMPRTPEQQVQFNKLMKDHDNAIANIDNQFPEEGATRKFEDGRVGRFTNGKWVDITEQSRGVVGG